MRSEVSKFNYPVVYWGNDDLQHSTSNEGNIYYSLAAAESYYQAADQQFKGANLDYDVSIYKLTNDKGYLSGCDIVLDDEAFNSLSLIKSSQSADRKTSDQQNEKPSDNFSVILDGLATASDAVISEEYEKRYTSLISGVDAKSCLILTNSLHFFNQIKGVKPGAASLMNVLNSLQANQSQRRWLYLERTISTGLRKIKIRLSNSIRWKMPPHTQRKSKRGNHQIPGVCLKIK